VLINFSPVLFEIELLSFVDYRAADEFTAFSREEREKATLDQIIAVANAEKDVSSYQKFLFFCRHVFYFMYRLEMISFGEGIMAKRPVNIIG
jgi:hypothetical protein